MFTMQTSIVQVKDFMQIQQVVKVSTDVLVLVKITSMLLNSNVERVLYLTPQLAIVITLTPVAEKNVEEME